jgi:hypothetical protein
MSSNHKSAWLILAVLLVAASGVSAQEELAYAEYRAIAQSAITLHHCAMFEPLDGQPGMMFVIGDKFGKLNVFWLRAGQDHERVWVSRQLEGNADEVLVADLDGDGLDDSILARTPRRLYVWDMTRDYFNSFESSPNDFQEIRAFTVADVDEDPAKEIVVNADRKIHYVDGIQFSKDWTSLNDFEATWIRCGDVDGDNRMELVLNTGQVLDSGTGNVEWEDQVFGTRLELLDFDGDGILEILTEGDGTPLRVWDADSRSEKRFQ